MERRWQVLLVASVAAFMAFIDVTIVNIAFPSIRASFPDASLARLSWVLNAYNIAFAALLVPAGRLGDRFGRRRAFLTGLGVFLAGSVACGLAPSVDVLIAARAVQAVGAAALVPNSLSLVLPEFPLERRATATALWGASGAIAASAGPTLGGLLVDWQSWRWVFFVNVAIGIPALVPARRLLRESREATALLPDPLGALLLAAAVAALALAIVEGPDWGWSSAGVVAAFVVAAALLPLFLLRSLRHPAPLFELSLFRVRSFAVANSGVFVYALGFYAMILCNVLFLIGTWRYSALRAGAAITPGPATAALTAPFAGRLADRFGQRATAIPGGLLFAGGMLWWLVAAGTAPHYLSDALPAFVISGAGVGLIFSSLSSAVVAELPRNRFATGTAISSTARQVGAVLGVSILLAILGPAASLHAFRNAWAFSALTGVLVAAHGAALGRVRARHVEAPADAIADTAPALAD